MVGSGEINEFLEEKKLRWVIGGRRQPWDLAVFGIAAFTVAVMHK